MKLLSDSGTCMPCKKQGKTKSKKTLGFFASMMLVILPKCPFCFMAFSSTMVLCGEGGLMSAAERTHVSEATIWVSVLCCLLTLIAVALNYRDKRTGIAIGLVLTGTACILFSVLKAGGISLYYTGVGLLFAGAWTNASLMYVLEKFRSMRGYNLARNQITGR